MVRAQLLSLLLLSCALPSCGGGEGSFPDPPGRADEPQPVDPGDGGGDPPAAGGEATAEDARRALTRASLDLRGVRPSIDEIERIEADPEQYAAMVEEFLHDPRFGSRVRSLFSEIFLTRQDYYYVRAADYGVEGEVAFAAAVGEEPLHILSTIAEQDLPYTEIVTADWTMANGMLTATWPLKTTGEAANADGWQKARYTDGRPHAGILTTNGLWWRYMTNDSNANRGRANAITRILLCQDFLSKPIEFDRNVNLLDSDALNDALQSNPGCYACHSALDPLASYLYGFYYYLYDSKLDVTYYHPEREDLWRDMTGAAPGYYGEPGSTIADLGRQIAADPRLPECLVENVYELLLQRDAGLDDTTALTAHREDLLAAGLTIRPLLASVMDGEEYRTARDAAGQPRRKMLSPEQLGSAIEDLTGFRFTYAGYDVLTSDTYGVKTFAGGVDGTYVTKPATEPTATIVLVQERLAQAAAAYAAEQDREDPGGARLFTEITFRETVGSGLDSDHTAMVAQIQALHLRVFGTRVAADGPEVEANLALWAELYAIEEDQEAAWAGLLSVLLRDPEFIFY